MTQSPADIRKLKPGYQATVAAYTLLKMATDTLLVRFSKKERQANRAPAETEKKSILLLDKLRMIFDTKFHFTLRLEVFFFQIH